MNFEVEHSLLYIYETTGMVVIKCSFSSILDSSSKKIKYTRTSGSTICVTGTRPCQIVQYQFYAKGHHSTSVGEVDRSYHDHPQSVVPHLKTK